MLNIILTHKIRKDIIRKNKKQNHREYLHALEFQPKIRYWSGYHKKKLIFFGLVALISWNYELHISLMHYFMGMRSPKQFISHLFFGSQKIEKTVNEQKIVGWPFDQETLDVLTKLFYQTDKRLIFGVGRNYLFQIYSDMGLLEKPQEVNNFWRGGGFYKKRNQLVSGVSYQQFITLYSDGFKKLNKANSEYTHEEYLQQFFQLFLKKAPQIQKWQKQFNKLRYTQFLKTLLTDDQKKSDLLCILMKENVDITEEEVDKILEEKGMKGLGIKDKWTYWKNRQILISLREFYLHQKLNLTIFQGRQRMEFEQKLKELETELELISKKKNYLKSEYKNIYQEELI